MSGAGARHRPPARVSVRIALLAVPALLAVAAPLPAQGIRVGAGAALASPLLRDGNGTEVRLGMQPVAELRVAPSGWRRGPVQSVLVARAGAGAVRLRAPDARWRGGTAWQADVAGGGALRPTAWLDVRALVGLTWLDGPRDVEPLARRTLRPAVEAAATLARPGSRWGVDVAVQGYRISPAAGAAGGVARLLVGVSHAP